MASKQYFYDITIIGAGGSGLSSALFLSKLLPHIKIAILCKTYAMGSHTTSAKGGINATLGNIKPDNISWHIHDTLSSGKGLCDVPSARTMCSEAPSIIDFLQNIGVEFDKTANGLIDQRVYGGQTTHFGKGELANRVCFVKDHTGHAVMDVLFSNVQKNKNITIFNYTQALELQKGVPNTILAYKMDTGTIEAFHSNYVIVGTGGFSQIYKTNSSSHLCTGCGHKMLFQAGFSFKDIELVQFHPTGLKNSGMLISEACRSYGAFLRNAKGEKFMEKYHHLEELAPRDIVAMAIHTELQHGDVFLDLTHINEDIIKNTLISSHTVAKHFAKVDISKELLPISPTAHYNMGGVMVDENYHVGNNIYSIGESACASVHGANRLGCNSLLELFTSAKVASQNIANNFKETTQAVKYHPYKEKNADISTDKILNIIEDIKMEMQKNASIVKNESSLMCAIENINNIYEHITPLNNFTGVKFDTNFILLQEAQSLVLMAKCVLEASIFRKHSIGSHFREDFLDHSKNPEHTVINQQFIVKYSPVKK